MTAVLLSTALAAAAVLSWLHLRPTGQRRAVAMPSLQHLRGSRPRRRRVLHLEEPLAWSLRAGCLLLALVGVWASRSGWAADFRPALLVDPAAASEAWDDAAVPTQAAARLAFDGEQPRVAGDVPGLVRAALQECSDTRAACLLRGASLLGRPIVLVGPLASAEWRLALGRWRQPFAFLRTAARPEAVGTPPPALAHVRLAGTSAAAEGWSAALAVAAGESLGPRAAPTGPASPGVVVVEAGSPSSPPAEDVLTVVAVDRPTQPLPDAPAVQKQTATGLVFPDPLDLAAGTPGLGLVTSLSFLPDARFSEVLPVAALGVDASRRQLALAATPEELGMWAHQGSVVPLARALLAAGLPGPAAVGAPPVGGPQGWREATGRAAPVGLLDVHPGKYARDDGRVTLQLERASVPGTTALDDAELLHLGGHPWQGPGPPRRDVVSALLGAALALWLLGVWRTRQARRAWLPAAGVAAVLALLSADARWQAEVVAPWEAAGRLPPGASRAQLAALAGETGVALHQGADGVLACASALAQTPCTFLGTVGLAAAPAADANLLLFDEMRPRVDVLSVQAPGEVAVGQTAELWVTVRVRRADGRRLTVTARSTSAAPTSQQLEVQGTDAVRTLRLQVSPLTEGISFVAVEAALAGEAQAQDGWLLALAARTRAARRLVLAAAPGWEARAAADALQAPGVEVQLLAPLGVQAVVARGRAPQLPLPLLRTPEGLSGVDLVALVGFGPASLDATAAWGLRHFVESGGAVLLLDAPGAAAALGVDLAPVATAAPLQRLSGQLDEEVVAFRGYPPAATRRTPALSAVLGWLGSTGESARLPWVVGRALGQGRVAVVTAPDLWRLSAPAAAGTAYAALLGRLLGWLEAPRASRTGVFLSNDWNSLRVQDSNGTHFVPLPATGPVSGLAVDAVDVPRFLRWPRARLRAAAAAARHPFLEVDGAAALTSAWRRLPPPPRWPSTVHLRASDAAFGLFAGLLALEALARRLYGGGGRSGSRSTTAASSGETGGTTSGDGRSQRASATAAARAAASRDTSSPAA